jgi:tyrosyl-tRNA synthetase
VGRPDLGILELLEELGWVDSRSEASRLVQQGAGCIEAEKIADPTIRIVPAPEPRLLRVGKRRFVRFVLDR